MGDAPRKVLVLGLGNTLLSDDGVGVHVIRHLASDPLVPAGLRPCDGGTLGFRLLGELVDADAVLFIDAADLGASPGAFEVLDRDILIRHVSRAGRMSAHEAGLVDLLTLARLDGWTPKRLALLGIQPLVVDWGDALSEPVTLSLPAACAAAIRTVLDWQYAA